MLLKSSNSLSRPKNYPTNKAPSSKSLKFWLSLILALFFASPLISPPLSFGQTSAPKTIGLKVLPQPLDRGTAGWVELEEGGVDCQGRFDQRPIFFFLAPKIDKTPGRTPGSRWVGLFGADIMLKPGQYPLTVSCPGQEGLKFSVVVREKTYGLRNIKVPHGQVDLSPENLERAAREKKLVDKALATTSPDKLWRGAFLEPVKGQVNSSFGRQTKINGVLNPRPHAGADYLVKTGTPVKAPARGQVILTGDHFFSGQAIYVDHGQGLLSMYFHLSEIMVSDGQMVEKGDIIAKSGQSGRVTGAHLHYGVYLNGARIDPIPFRKMTNQF
ncbi:MAG: M23 family metallopeptidase [Deltaproteobacteria bacterium]|jgi:biotin carboxyl carrier protein|nr:M23 family metallopeptidase [Deltaproteobacteria bacterium]